MSLFRNLIASFQRDLNINSNHEKLVASLMVLAWVVEARDPYTGGHLWRVSKFSNLLANKSGLNKKEIASVTIGGFLHDIGKIGIPDAILNKKDSLTDEEYQIIKTHPELGRRMLSVHPLHHLALEAIYMHHETPNGKGYPQGLTSNRIPVAAKIVGICDAFDAMTSTRPYRSGMPVEKAINIIRSNLGIQFDGLYGEYFLSLANEDSLSSIVGHTNEGIPIHDCLICGPTVELNKESKIGHNVYCNACSAEYVLVDKIKGFQFTLKPTGKKGDPTKTTTKPDESLIAKIIKDSSFLISKELLI